MSHRKSPSAEMKNKDRKLPKKSSLAKKESAAKKAGSKNQQAADGQKTPLKKFMSRSNILKSLISNLESAKTKKELVVEKIEEEQQSSPYARKTRSEDPNFNSPKVPRLMDLCIGAMVEHYPKHSKLLKKIPKEFKKKIVDRLPLDLPLSITARSIDLESYWKNKCKERWMACDPGDHGERSPWKMAYLETNLQEQLENFIPDKSSMEDLKKTIKLSSKFVERLEILQLLPKGLTSNWNASSSSSNLDASGASRSNCPQFKTIQISSAIDNEDDADLDHLDFSEILPLLPKLRELHLCYSVRNCGTDFQRNYFRISDQDCRSLAKSFHLCPQLEHLSIMRSHLDNSGLEVLCDQLKHHPTLRHLDLSHNIISDAGAEIISSTLLGKRTNTLRELNLTNNSISASGGRAMAQSLTGTSSLQRLELRLNKLGDEAGGEILTALEHHRGLVHLGLGGNFLGKSTVEVFCRILKTNDTLTSVDLSCNNLGEGNGELIQQAMKNCHSITELDLRETGIGKELELLISEICDRNSDSILSKVTF